jgi:hypothetical protein
MNEQTDILWIGGPAAAGKTTVSRLFAQKYGFGYYSVDAHAFDHEKRAAAAGLHTLGTGPGDFDRRPMIIEDLRSIGTPVVVEGAFVTPDMAGVGGNSVWLMPSKEEQLVRLEHRNPGGDHDGCVWGWGLIHGQLEGSGARIIVVDGQTVEETVSAVEQSFKAVMEK